MNKIVGMCCDKVRGKRKLEGRSNVDDKEKVEIQERDEPKSVNNASTPGMHVTLLIARERGGGREW